MREIAKWITIGGRHIPIFKGEGVKQKISKFRETNKMRKAIQSKEAFKDYIKDEFKNMKGIEKVYASKENRYGQWRSIYKRK